MTPENSRKVILAVSVLHNFMRDHNISLYCPPGFSDSISPDGEVVDGSWRLDRNGTTDEACNRHYTQEAAVVRDAIRSYVCGPGSVEWQIAHVRRTS